MSCVPTVNGGVCIMRRSVFIGLLAFVPAFSGLAATLQHGQCIQATIGAPGEVDTHFIAVTAGDVVQVRMTTIDTIRTTMELYDPTGVLVTSQGGNAVSAEVTTNLVKTGTYTIACKDVWGLTGSYGLSMVKLHGYHEPGPGDTDIGTVLNGEVHLGNIAMPGDLDAANFWAQSGDVVQLRMSTINTVRTTLQLYDPDGLPVGAWGGNAFVAETTMTLPKTGVFTAICRDDWGLTGSYSFTVRFIVQPSVWYGAINTGGGWRWCDWFGFFNIGSEPWIYHIQHGWICAFTQTPHDIWFWTIDMGWIWTGCDVYPFLFRHGDGTWLWYNGGTNPRWFVNMATGQWESRQ